MNGGALASGAEPATTPVYSATNGGWNSGTGVYTPPSGDPSASVTVGDFAHVFTDGATTPAFIGRVTAVNSTTVTVSTSAKSGTAPTTAGSGISINVGGAWAGPSGAVGFPFTFVTGLMKNASNDRQRVNIKNDQTYNMTAMMDLNAGSSQTPVTFQGYSTTFGDFGRATIDGGTSGAAYVLMRLNNNAESVELVDFIFDHNGATSAAALVEYYRGYGMALRCTFRNSRGNGISAPFGTGTNFVLCDAYANLATGFQCSSQASFYRCIASRNGSNGFQLAGVGNSLIECISAENTSLGFSLDQTSGQIIGCIAYANGTDGIFIGWKHSINVINCITMENGTYGISGYLGSVPKGGLILNCGFYGNVSGTTNNLQGNVVSGSVNFAASPFADAANGDFQITDAAAKETGFGAFQWADTNYSARANNVAYPDIGAIAAQAAGGGGGGGLLVNPGMRGGMI